MSFPLFPIISLALRGAPKPNTQRAFQPNLILARQPSAKKTGKRDRENSKFRCSRLLAELQILRVGNVSVLKKTSLSITRIAKSQQEASVLRIAQAGWWPGH